MRKVFIGVAPFDINHDENRNYDKYGWYFDCYDLTLRSGPPHSSRDKYYGSSKEKGQYVHTGDIIVVVMDTAKGEVNLGVAFEGIPLDKPLVPCVILGHEDDSVELVI